MSKWHNRRAKVLHRELMQKLGGCCQLCGSTEDLEFDHFPNGRTYPLSNLSPYQRVRRYMREYAEGIGRCLCKSCNSAKPERKPMPLPFEEDPF